MKKIKVNKLPIVIPVLAAVAVTGGYLLLQGAGENVAWRQISLGERYLQDLDYESAALAFAKAIDVDPSAQSARIGLARAYAGMEEYTQAAGVLTEIDDAMESEEILIALKDIAKEGGNSSDAARYIWNLIEITDDDAYYDELEETIKLSYETPHSYSAGTDQEALILNQSLLTKGENTFGQLGTQRGLGMVDAATADFADGNFAGVPAKVFCGGRTTYVIDDGGMLWISGENRWGQSGSGYQSLNPQEGWYQVENGENIVKAAGMTGMLFALKSDGSLWMSGYGENLLLERASQVPYVLDLAASSNRIAVLSVDGAVYEITRNYEEGNRQNSLNWRRVGQDAVQISLSGNNLWWLDNDGYIHSQDGMGINAPSDWLWSENGAGIKPSMDVKLFAGTDTQNFLFLDTDNTLWSLQNGVLEIVEENSTVTALYNEEERLIAEYEDGSVRMWEEGETALREINA